MYNNKIHFLAYKYFLFVAISLDFQYINTQSPFSVHLLKISVLNLKTAIPYERKNSREITY